MQNISSPASNHYRGSWSSVDTAPSRAGRPLYYYPKRALDIAITLLALLLIWPLLLLIALLIKLDSSGPIFFVQERVGARRRVHNRVARWEVHTFRMVKFRSMTHNADQSLHMAHIKAYVAGTLDANEGCDSKFKLVADQRVTRVGHFIRKTSLDELPQLWNVLKGEMSLVGPRPVPCYEAELYQPEHYERLTALPGLTGLWQVEGRGEVTFAEMMRLDLAYVRTCSLRGDLAILLRTIPAALLGRGAA